MNTVEPGTVVPVYHHVTNDETFILLKGKVRVLAYNDEGEVKEKTFVEHEEEGIIE